MNVILVSNEVNDLLGNFFDFPKTLDRSSLPSKITAEKSGKDTDGESYKKGDTLISFEHEEYNSKWKGDAVSYCEKLDAASAAYIAEQVDKKNEFLSNYMNE